VPLLGHPTQIQQVVVNKLIAALRLVANDVPWSAGDGPLVEGPAESLILVMAGRRAGLDEPHRRG